MNLKLEQDSQIATAEITIKYSEMNHKLEKIIHTIKSIDKSFSVISRIDKTQQMIEVQDIYYIEVVDRKTFIYMEKDVFEIDRRLYEISEELFYNNFCQINKNTILNVSKLSKVKQLPNSRLKAYLINNEAVIVSRKYISILRNALKGEY